MIPTVSLTPIGREDIDGILAVEAAAFAQPWGRPSILGELEAADSVQFAARTPPQTGGGLVGFIFARILGDEMHLMKLAVDPEWRNRGAATALLEAALAEARRRGAQAAVLEVRPANTAAVAFYRQAGFQNIGERPNYYPETGENALVMAKSLKEAS